MIKSKVVALKTPREISEDPLTELLRTGAKQLIAEAVEAELQVFLTQYAELRNKKGQRQVVRNGYLPEREILTGIGEVEVKIPNVSWLLSVSRNRAEKNLSLSRTVTESPSKVGQNCCCDSKHKD